MTARGTEPFLDGFIPDSHRGGEVLSPGLQISLAFKGLGIDVFSDSAVNIDRVLELQAVATDMELGFPEAPSGLGRITYIDQDDIDIQYNPERQEIVVKGPQNLFTQGDALVYIAEYMATCLRTSESGLLLLHSAAVYDSEKEASYVFLGEKGAGKTTLALRMCHEYGFRLIGNDQVYVGQREGEVITAGGNGWFNIRDTAVRSDPYIKSILPQRSVDGPLPAWNSKQRVEPRELGVEIFDAEASVEEIFHVRIDHTQEDIYAKEWTGVQRNLFLHEKLGRHITGQATPFQDDKGNYIGSLPVINLDRSLAARDELVGAIIKKGITEVFAPSGEAITDYIVRNYQ